MAAPKEKTIADLNGVWVMNTDLSDPIDLILKMQNIAYTTRTFIGCSTITLTATQTTGRPLPPAPADAPDAVLLTINQSLSPVRFMPSVKGTVESRCLDGVLRTHEDHIFGKVEGYSEFIERSEVGDADLEKNWIAEDEERAGAEGKAHVISYVKNLDEGNGWVVTQIWGFQVVDGKRRYCRNIRVTRKGEKTLYSRLVYDYKGPAPGK